MYVPAHFAVDDGQLAQLLDDFPVADLVTVTPQGLLATFLPVLYEPTTGERGSISATSLAATNSGAALCSLKRW